MARFVQFLTRSAAASSLVLATAWPAAAQTAPAAAGPASPPPGKVYAYVEQMPQLPGGGGTLAIVRAIQERVSYPARAMKARAEGRVFVSFIVAPSGLVEHVNVVKSFRPDCDLAVVEAVKHLPRFEPGRQLGQPVAVSFTAPVTFRLPPLPPTGKKKPSSVSG